MKEGSPGLGFRVNPINPNCPVMPDAPFGGYKQSGRELREVGVRKLIGDEHDRAKRLCRQLT